ncbi:MAG: biotin/lipoyl-binding protein, partial [Planctomycetaceae bacterium]|nr:biotin/lipoyl-binding protein [Planctomycetaceae bacterium]
MKNWFSETLRIFAPILIVAFGIGGFMVFGKRPDVKNEIPVAPIPPVQTIAAVKSPGELTIEVEGVAAPSRQIAISAEVEGRIVKKTPQSRAGKFVTEGDLLLQIDPIDYKLEVDRLSAQVTQSRAELSAIDVQIKSNEKLISLASEEHDMQRRELERHAVLAKRGVSTESQLDTIRGTELASRRALQTL